MKKLLFLLFASVLVLVGCSENEEGSESNNETASAEEANDNESTETEETDSEETESEEAESEESNEGENDVYFEDNVLQTDKFKIEITDTKVIPVGEKGNEYGENPVFAIWYNTTNLTDEDLDPSTAWMFTFTAIQDNDPNIENELSVGMLPDDAHLDTQMANIKKDGTVENSVSYELTDTETPVTLVAIKDLIGDEIGRADYEIE
ncbi:DUF5067 domain-containing protein [Oceanobacillus neutriphilus]|uniref:DUF5067 domain-containing protein n=1 Tax=Oceanobacillus neutriphilus TaxID=531815 RepID=A0ABQ2NPZ7_9BACI|nr:DUF5067 domain-containing protein [Oceanobacillus neutriphilus]GGP07923.1 hypothetical protein GCM10011346_06110 [Oceanobacillus neutriphilus]